MAHDATSSPGESEEHQSSPSRKARKQSRAGNSQQARAGDASASSSTHSQWQKKGKKAASEAARTQSYDNLLKRLVEHQAKALLPIFFQHLPIVRLEELTIELLIPPRRGDRVYKAYLRRADGSLKTVILQVEFEADDNQKMDKRLHVYHAVLHEKYELPVYSLLVYPFEVTGVSSPLIEDDDGTVIDIFHYRTLPLFNESALNYVEQGVVPMYGLLPVMKDTSDELLLKAIDAMVEYYGDNESLLRDELLCFRVLFERAHQLSAEEEARVERRLHMFDPLLENSPWVQAKLAESLEKGLAKGLAKGEARGEFHHAQEMVIRFVQRRFPSLGEVARTCVQQATQTRALNALMEQLWFAPDEFAARALLESTLLS